MNVNEVLQQVDILYGESRGKEAEALMREAIAQAIAGQDNEGLLMLLNELLGYYRETSQVENSYAIADQAIKLAEGMGLLDTLPYATTLLNVANAYRAGGRLQDSLECYEQVRRIYEKTLTSGNMLVASLENNLSLLYQEMGRFGEAKESLLRALEIVLAKDAGFEVAVTYANLAGTCMQLGEAENARDYAFRAISDFESMGVADAHYGAALAALGNFFYAKHEYDKAHGYFVQARDIMEKNLGRNEYYDRLQEYVKACEAAFMPKEDGEKARVIKGLDLCRRYYEAYGKPMIESEFKEYADRIAVGLAGEGSDAFGFDDEISQDHDWGPGFCMWVTADTYELIGAKLQKAYEELPSVFEGYERTISSRGRGRRGVMIIDVFYKRLLPVTEAGKLPEDIDWRLVTDEALAAAVNGEVFRDDEGIFTKVREDLCSGYPEPIRLRKLAECCARFAQSGQYNYNRCLLRGDAFTAGLMLTDCVREAMKLKHYLAGKYPPHDKWLRYSTEMLPGGKQLTEILLEAVEMDRRKSAGAEVMERIEKAAEFLAQELYAIHAISDTDCYLDAHTEELLVKAELSEKKLEQLIDMIIRLEFEAFDKVKNEGGRASCQNDWPTFYVMRKSQYLTWNKTMLKQYYYDFKKELEKGHNLIEEKYGRMMESTAPEEYEKIKQYFPLLSADKQAIIGQITAIQVSWMEEFAARYPKLAENARSVRATEDNLFNTSYETYLRGEISTYSDKMLELYGRYVVQYASENKNLACEIMKNSTLMYGYHSLQAAEDAY